MTEAINTPPCNIGKSLIRIASTINLPSPFIAKTDSTKTVPPKSAPNCNPTTVITGISAFLKACLYITTLSFTPLLLLFVYNLGV